MTAIHVSEASMYGTERPEWRRIAIGCPGCGGFHTVNVEGPTGDRPPDDIPVWGWNGDLDNITITPSILSRGTYVDGERRCHSFFSEGRWHYLNDCTHDLAGQTADPIDLPDWLIKER